MPDTASSRLSALLREWDKGSKKIRMQILADFVVQCRSLTGPQLEKALGNGASLLLARITSWLRLSYALDSSVALQLRAISIFVAASSGQRFLAEFVEVGGVATVVEILSLKELPTEDHHEAIQLLSSVASAGRHFKEIICKAEGPLRLQVFMEAVHPERHLEEARDLLVTLGRGNPAFSGRVHHGLLKLLRCEHTVSQRLAAAGLRALVAAMPSSQHFHAVDPQGQPLADVDGECAVAAVALFGSFNLQVQYEAMQLLGVLVTLETLEEHVLKQLVAPLLLDPSDHDESAPLHVQAASARCLGQLISGLPVAKRSHYCASLMVMPWLCTLLLLERSPECQSASVQALQLLGWCAGSPLEEMRQYLPQELLSSLLEATDVTQAVLRLTSDTIVEIRALLEPFLLANRPSRGELAPEVDDEDEIDLDSPDSPEPGDSNAQPDLV